MNRNEEAMLNLSRRELLGYGAAGLLTSVATLLARRSEANEAARLAGPPRAQSLIVLWMAGGPSQLESFDPHPGRRIAGDTRAIETSLRGVKLAAGLPRLAEQMQSLALVRSLVSKEGDH